MKIIQAESEVVQKLAIDLLKESKSGFDVNVIKKLVDQIHPNDERRWLALNVTKVSFLCQYDVNQDSYNFVHLTLQEVLAAQWLVEDKSRLCTHITLYKYDPRFERIWRFVAGLVQAKDDENQLFELFSKIKGEPRDLLGPVQRLVILCLSEVESKKLDVTSYPPKSRPSNFPELREILEYHL